MKIKFVILILVVGLLTACGSQPESTPASSPTEGPVTVPEGPTDLPAPTDTSVPPTEAPTQTPVQSTEVSFSAEVLPILESRCKNCHGGDRGTAEGLDMTSYANLMTGSDNGPVVVSGNADGSLIVEMLVQNKMPKRGPKLTPPQVQLIIDWVNQGALNN